MVQKGRKWQAASNVFYKFRRVNLMHYLKSNKKKLFVLLFVCICVISISYLQTFSIIPEKLTLIEGEEYVYDFKSFFVVNIKADQQDYLKVNNTDIKASGNYLKLLSPLNLKTQKKGRVNLNFKAFGIIPIKTMQVDIIPSKKLMACGNTIGVKIYMNGVLVVGISDVDGTNGEKVEPAKDGGIRAGDVIYEINGERLTGIKDLVKKIDNNQGSKLEIKYKRGSSLGTANITPAVSVNDHKYHIGLWVRDSTAGIGTMTFYDPQTQSFGALGHGITDVDTGILMPVDRGEVIESNIISVRKGEQGTPGELKGIFIENRPCIGCINKNGDFGIYGQIDSKYIYQNEESFLPIGLRGQVKVGPAYIISNIEGKNTEKFSIYIEKVSRQSFSGPKGMVIRVTDKRLLNTTGGIVQGMSGSPIIQNGKIVGAVTHVLVNDPTRGYGIFIEWMLKSLNSEVDLQKIS